MKTNWTSKPKIQQAVEAVTKQLLRLGIPLIKEDQVCLISRLPTTYTVFEVARAVRCEFTSGSCEGDA